MEYLKKEKRYASIDACACVYMYVGISDFQKNTLKDKIYPYISMNQQYMKRVLERIKAT